MAKPRCPKCGSHLLGTIENLRGIALVADVDAAGTPDYEGDTIIDWDSSETMTDERGRPIYACLSCGHEGNGEEMTTAEDTP